MARRAVVSDEALAKVVSPVLDKTSNMVEKTLDNNVKVPDVRGVNFEEAKNILESMGFIVSVLEKRTPHKDYAKYRVNEIVDMEYPKPNPLLKGISRGSVVKIFTADEDILMKSNSWRRKFIDQ
ncbi:PASTA domain-containing protein [Floricoccus penangensis]|uniref:PASTA domain-containing protein n=1 Tax=Floricoccus penangensis TaxID=1859475 RepID=UPI0020413A99|nr:PASTA domain-containing protein [Floricoccus penangensis]